MPKTGGDGTHLPRSVPYLKRKFHSSSKWLQCPNSAAPDIVVNIARFRRLECETPRKYRDLASIDVAQLATCGTRRFVASHAADHLSSRASRPLNNVNNLSSPCCKCVASTAHRKLWVANSPRPTTLRQKRPGPTQRSLSVHDRV